MDDDKSTQVNTDVESSKKENADAPEPSQEQNKNQIAEGDSEAKNTSASEPAPFVTGQNSSAQQAVQNTTANNFTASPSVSGKARPTKKHRSIKARISSFFTLTLLLLSLAMAYLLWQWWENRNGESSHFIPEVFALINQENPAQQSSDAGESNSAPIAKQEISGQAINTRLLVAEEAIWQLKEWQQRSNKAQQKNSGDQGGGFVVNPLEEAMFFINMADQRHWLGAQNEQILPLLQQAKKTLLRANRPAYFPLMQLINKDMLAIEGMQENNITELYQLLQAVKDKVNSIPLLAGKQFKEEMQKQLAAQENKEVQTVGDKLSQKLNALVRIRYHQMPVTPLLDDVSHRQYKLLSEMAIMQAQSALLNQQPQILAMAIASARNSLQALLASAPTEIPLLQEKLNNVVLLQKNLQRKPLLSAQALAKIRNTKNTSHAVPALKATGE